MNRRRYEREYTRIFTHWYCPSCGGPMRPHPMSARFWCPACKKVMTVFELETIEMCGDG